MKIKNNSGHIRISKLANNLRNYTQSGIITTRMFYLYYFDIN